MALPKDGKIIACDINEEWTQLAREFWDKVDAGHKIELRLAPAQQTLQDLIDNGETETFDFAFIDADKSSYDIYYEQCLQLVRKGGLIALDNTFMGGKVVDPEQDDNSTKAIRAINSKLLEDDRVTISVIAIADGLTLARKV